MRKWNQTTITWRMWGFDNGYGPIPVSTNIAVSHPREGEEKYHICSRVEITAHRDRTAKLTMVFHRGGKSRNNVYSYGDKEVISRKIQEMFGRLHEVKVCTSHDGTHFYLTLNADDPFCEWSVDIVMKLLMLFGVEDKQSRVLGNFDISQKTLVFWGGKWQEYKEYLRQKFTLQEPYVYCWTN